MKTQFSLIVVAVSCCFSLASAKQTGHAVSSYFNTYNGVEAKALFQALKGAGAKADGVGFAVTDVQVEERMGYNLDPSDACFKSSSYEISFTDKNNNNKAVTVKGNCKDAASVDLGKALQGVGGTDVVECGMGRCNFVAKDVSVDYDKDATGDDQWYAQLVIGQ